MACQRALQLAAQKPTPRPAQLQRPSRRQLLSRGDRRRSRIKAGGWGAPSEPRVRVGVPPPLGGGGPPPPPVRTVGGPGSWFTVLLLLGATVSTLGGGLLVFVLHLRPVLKAAERAAAAAEEAAKQMDVAAQEMEKTAKLMQEDMPLTFQDMQRTSKEFEILGKQLNYLTGVVVKPVREPVQWVGKAAETTSSTVQSVTTTSIRRVVDDIKTLANSLTPTIDQVRRQLASFSGMSLSSGSSSTADTAATAAATAAADSRNRQQVAAAAPVAALGNGVVAALVAPLSRAAAVAMQAEAANREVNVSRRQADAQRWIANWRSRSRGNRKAAAVAAAMAADAEAAEEQQRRQEQQQEQGVDSARLAQSASLPQMGQLLATGVLAVEQEAAAAAVYAALERAQRAAEEAASASGALEAALRKAEDRGALPSIDSGDDEEELPTAASLTKK